MTDLEVSELGEGVDNDAEDDVEADGGDEYEERRVVDHQETELGKSVLGRVTHQVLHKTIKDGRLCPSMRCRIP